MHICTTSFFASMIKSQSKISKSVLSALLIIILAAMPSIGNAQNSSIKQVKDKCITALKKNDNESFVSTFSNPVDISLPNKENSYSKTQAKVVMKKFLSENKTKSFKLKQSGKSTGGSEFIIASLLTDKGVKYQIYMLFTLSNGEAHVHLVEFELEEE